MCDIFLRDDFVNIVLSSYCYCYCYLYCYNYCCSYIITIIIIIIIISSIVIIIIISISIIIIIITIIMIRDVVYSFHLVIALWYILWCQFCVFLGLKCRFIQISCDPLFQ